jgi:hypothetical protein
MVYHDRRTRFKTIEYVYKKELWDGEEELPVFNEKTTLEQLGLYESKTENIHRKFDGFEIVNCLNLVAKELGIKDLNGLVRVMERAEPKMLGNVVDILGEF